MDEKLQVPKGVFEAILKVRESGKTNMFDVNAVLYYLNELEEYKAVVWVDENRRKFGKVVLGVIEVIDEQGKIVPLESFGV